MPSLSRRSALLGLTAAFSFGRSRLAVAEAPTDKRLVVINLRGALDGIAAVVPYGDPAYTDLRGTLSPQPGEPNGPLDLGGFYALHPALANLHAMYGAGEFLPIHAVAGPYRERSHFLAQDFLESGGERRLDSGWLNRVLVAIPTPPGVPPEREGIAIGGPVPLLLRGPAPVSNWIPGGMPTPEATLLPTPTPEVAEEDSINTLLGKNRDDARAMDRNGGAILDVSDVVYTPREMRLSPP